MREKAILMPKYDEKILWASVNKEPKVCENMGKGFGKDIQFPPFRLGVKLSRLRFTILKAANPSKLPIN